MRRRPKPLSRAPRRVLASLGWLCVLLAAPAARAQDAPADARESLASPAEHETRSGHSTRLYFGMWTMHLKHDRWALNNNWAIGVTTHGFFGATFVNSFGRRAFTGGLQRTIVSTRPAQVGASVGYRLGFVTGYDGRFIPLARKTPVLPLVQPFVSIDVTHVSVEVSYTFVVISTAISYRF